MCDPQINSDEESTPSPPTTSPPTQPSNNGSTYLSSLLTSTLVITIKDGRSFVGHFICTDKEQNIILNQAEEFLPRAMTDKRYDGGDRPISVGAWGGREMGMVMLRGKDIVKVEAQLPMADFKTTRKSLYSSVGGHVAAEGETTTHTLLTRQWLARRVAVKPARFAVHRHDIGLTDHLSICYAIVRGKVHARQLSPPPRGKLRSWWGALSP